MSRFLICYLSLVPPVFFWANLVWGAEYELFRRRAPIDNYPQVIDSLQTDDILKFDGEHRFRFLKLLGSGNSTTVLLVEPLVRREGDPAQMALRIPRGEGKHPVIELSYSEVLNKFIAAYPILMRNGVVVPQMYHSVRGEFAAMEVIGEGPLLRDFFRTVNHAERSKIVRVQESVYVTQKKDALKFFARSTARLRKIWDFNDQQIIYEENRRRWVLLDWLDASPHRWYLPWQGNTVFDFFIRDNFPDPAFITQPLKALFAELNQEIKDERQKQQNSFMTYVLHCLR